MREEFFITRQGKQYVLFAGLLDEAHSRGLSEIDTELIQVPEDANGQVAITKATVVIEKADQQTGEVLQSTFTGIGDASPQNVSRNIVPHLIRMSETRAKARALRDAVNVGAASLEEMDDGDSGSANGSGNGSSSGSASGSGKASGNSGGSASQGGSGGSSSSRGQMHAVEGGQSQTPEPPAKEEGDPGYGGAEIAGQEPRQAVRSQIEFIKTLAEERGSQGVAKLEKRLGKQITELTRDEAERVIDWLTPDDEAEQATADEQGG